MIGLADINQIKQRLNVEYDFCNNPLPPESVCGIHVLNEGNSCCLLYNIISKKCYNLNRTV